jgi:hypothetical protein
LKELKEQAAIVESDLNASVADVAAQKAAVLQLEGQLTQSQDDGTIAAELLEAAHDNITQLKQVSHAAF